VFNSDAIKDVTLYKGGNAGQLRSRLSSVVDIKMKDGEQSKIGCQWWVGADLLRLNMEGPLIKNKGSFTINARRTYVDLFTRLAFRYFQSKKVSFISTTSMPKRILF